jgi:predicted RNase H-like HicB family nuclease
MSTETRHFTGTATRDGKWWAVSIDMPDAIAYTQGRSLDDAEFMARDAIAGALDIDVEDVTVTLTVVAGVAGDLTQAALEAVARRNEAQREADQAMRAAAVALAGAGVNLRDSGRILRVSHQRVGQLLAEEAA